MARARPITGIDPHDTTARNARMIARARLVDMYSWEHAVDMPYDVRELHDLRIAVKRLRYTLEVFAEQLPAASNALVEELTALQDELGTLHDIDVMIALLRLCLGGSDVSLSPEHGLNENELAKKNTKPLVPPDLLGAVLNRAKAPSLEERSGLELFLKRQEQEREAQYATFRQHWYRLQARDFRRQILHMLEDE